MRHADANLKKAHHSDFERELSPLGVAELQSMHSAFKKVLPAIDFVYCSSAIRAKQTFDQIKIFFPSNVSVSFFDDLYNATKDVLWKKINDTDEEIKNILIIGHNPGLSYFVEDIGNNRIGIFSTSMAVIMNTEEYYCNLTDDSLSIEEVLIANPHLQMQKNFLL